MRKKRFVSWSDRQKKAYHRIFAGLRKHRCRKARFMTLTSAPGMKVDMQKAFHLLNMRLFWVIPLHFVASGDLSYEVACRLYGENNLEASWNFDYMKVCTAEGAVGQPSVFEFGRVLDKGVCGVIHLLFFGIWIPQHWLSEQWFDITGTAFVVDVRETKRVTDGTINQLASYCVEQYTAGQEKFLSYYCSRDWVFPGAWKCYQQLRDDYKNYSVVVDYYYGWPVYQLDKRGLRGAWEACIDRGGLLPKTVQVHLGADIEAFKQRVRDYQSNPAMYGTVW